MHEDDYGIPNNMFGPVPDVFFATVGRVVMVASILEVRLLDLLTEFDRAPQDKHAGKSASELVKGCCAALVRYDTLFAQPAGQTLEGARDVLRERNAVVHSVWPNPRAHGAFGWRPVREKRGDPPDPTRPFESITLDARQLRDLISRSAALVREVDRLRERAPAHRLAT